MFSTFVLATVFIGALLTSVVLWVLFLRVGLHWAKVPDVTIRRVIRATAIVIVLQIGLNVLSLFVSPSTDAQTIALGLVELAIAIILPCAVISTVFKTHFWRAFQAWLPTLFATVITLTSVLLLLRPFLYESFFNPTNAMAPTLVGTHWRGICAKCGQPNYCSPQDERYGTGKLPMICDRFHVTESSTVDKTVRSGDRFMVAKFLAPRRWDLVVFQYPADPSTLYVKRLVGLPNETVHIQEGSVWIDGKKQTPPDSLHGIEYLSELPGWIGPDLWGSANQPASLRDDEYFVLGDFSAQSKDSRFWEQGAPGHSPFAVPKAYLKGVVTHTYWPSRRWRVHR